MCAESKVEDGVTANDSRALQGFNGQTGTFPRHAANVAFILIAIVGLFLRVFFLGETLIDVNTLNNQLPWGYNAPASDYPYNRRHLTDTYVTPYYFFVSSYL